MTNEGIKVLKKMKTTFKIKIAKEMAMPPLKPEAKINLSKLKRKLGKNLERDQEENIIMQNILNFARESKRDRSGEPQYRYKKMGAGKRKGIPVKRYIQKNG